MDEIKERYVLMIWDSPDAVYTKMAFPVKNEMEFKWRGQKPTKMIIPENINTEKVQNLAKKNIHYAGLVISTDGNVIYDGRRAMEKWRIEDMVRRM